MLKYFFAELKLYTCNRIINKIPSHRIRLFFYRKLMRFSIGANTYIFLDCSFDTAGGIEIENNSVINPKCRLDSRGGIKIGEHVSISEEVVILTADHDATSPDFQGRIKKVEISNYAWIGTRAMILPGVKIGEGSLIAAGAVVTKNVPPFEIWGGVPAKKIGDRVKNLTYKVNYKRILN